MNSFRCSETNNCPLLEWIAAKDAQISEVVDELEEKKPDIFTPQEELIQHLGEVSIQAGRRELLNELIEFIDQPEA